MTTDTIQHSDDHAHPVTHGHSDTGSIKVFGFWVYLMSDLVIFGTLFATYAVLMRGTAGGPSGAEIFDLRLILAGTLLLLVSSFTYGMAVLSMTAERLAQLKAWLAVTFLLGAGFIAIELYEFRHLIHAGFGPDRSAFLSAFFTLVGTHGLHVLFGLLWLVVVLVQLQTKGLNDMTRPRILCLSLFWHFLDVVWICVFSFVYLMGVL